MTDLRENLERFLRDKGPQDSGISRDGASTYGSNAIKGASGGPLLPVYKFALPVLVSKDKRIPGYVRHEDRASGWLAIVATGTGGAFRVPLIYTDAMIGAMFRREAKNETEEVAVLEAAAVQMEVLFRKHLDKLNTAYALEPYRVKGVNMTAWTQDCVDQSANAMSYAWIWAAAGFMRFHRPYYPGYKGGITPHFYGRLQRLSDSQVLSFDLYHRGAGIGTGVKVKIGRDPAKGR